MREITIIDNSFALAGFTSGNEGIWSRNEPSDPPTNDYTALSERLEIPLSRFIRPYQTGGDKVEIVGAEHGGSGVIKGNDLKKVDGLITAEKGLILSIIAADCVPVYLLDKKVGVVGLLHCGWRSAAGTLIHNAVDRMKEIGTLPSDIQVITGPHICAECYEVGEEVRTEYVKAFAPKELDSLFEEREGRLYLSLLETIRLKAIAEEIPEKNISFLNDCTCHDTSYFSYRRGDRGKQNLAHIMMK